MKIYESTTELVGKTPLLRLKKIEKEYTARAKIFAKLEFFNPAGSIKDRAALAIIRDLEARGELKDGATIVEATSGNMGIGLAAAAAALGYAAVIVMPDTMSRERQLLIRAYGAKCILSDGKLGMAGAVKLAEDIAKSTPGAVLTRQFENEAGVMAHYNTTAPEIFRDLDGRVDIFVAGVGTGATLTGAARYLKEKNPSVRVVAVEPEKSPLLSAGVAGAHGIQGIGANFVPKILDVGLIDEVIPVSDERAFEYARAIASHEGALVGISSGAALAAAVELALRPENEDKNIVVVLPDTGERYLSGRLFEE